MKLKKFLMSLWSFIPIIGIFLLSRFLEDKGVVKPVFYNWNIIDFSYFLIGGVVIYFAFKKPNSGKSKKRSYEERSSDLKTISDIPLGETIIVVAFKERKPVFQTIDGYQEEMSGREGSTYILDYVNSSALMKGKTYRVHQSSDNKGRYFKQVSVMISADSSFGFG